MPLASPIRALVFLLAALAAPLTATAQELTLRGASQFDAEHVFSKTLRRFERLVAERYAGSVTFDHPLDGALDPEADFMEMLTRAGSIDYAIVAPSNMAAFAPAAPMMDMPFLFRDRAHWNAVLDSPVLQPLEDILHDTAGIVVIGYAGGGIRNLVSTLPVRDIDGLSSHRLRVMDAPIQGRIFRALGTVPDPIAYGDVYRAIETGRVDGLENESASIQNVGLYEVAPYISLTQHAITVRPIVMSARTFDALPRDLQEIILQAGAEAGRLCPQAGKPP